MPSDNTVNATTSGGLQINTSGNDAYLVADDGARFGGGRTQFTLEASFSITTNASVENILYSYAVDGASDNEIQLRVFASGKIAMAINNVSATTTNAYAQLLDGGTHRLSASWNSTGGVVVFYVDGVAVETISGIKSGYTIATGGTLVLAQEQDAELGLFNAGQILSGVIYDMRVFGDVRTATEIATYANSDVFNYEDNLVANWQFNDLTPGGEIRDAVSANNVTIGHATGASFTTNNPSLTLTIAENSANGTVVGLVLQPTVSGMPDLHP